MAKGEATGQPSETRTLDLDLEKVMQLVSGSYSYLVAVACLFE